MKDGKSFVPPSVGARARTLDAAWYLSDATFVAEREKIFARDWVYAAHESALARAGDYVVVTVAGESLIVVRDAADELHALYNVCRHRGTRLCAEEGPGHALGSLQCPYHAWTYALDGTLLAARNMDGIGDFERSAYPLKRAAVRSVEGFVFVSLADAPGESGPPLGALRPHLARWNARGLREARRLTYDVACNWKFVVQNYSECYHCPVIHPQLEALSPSESGRNDFVEGPVLGGYSDLRPAAHAMTTTGARTRPLVGDVDGADERRAYFYAIFPTLLLSLHPDMVMLHELQPAAPDRTRIACIMFFDPATIADEGFDPSDAVEFWDLTNRQDWYVCEQTHLGVSSRSYEPGPYANAEGLLHAFDRRYLAVMDGP
jgi:Rieske 2Fe-2S family protein